MKPSLAMVLVVLTTVSGCQQSMSGPSGMTPDQYAQYIEAYKKSVAAQEAQQAETQRQLDIGAAQIERQLKLLEAGEEFAQRSQALLDKHEEQAARYDKILERWEQQNSPAKPVE